MRLLLDTHVLLWALAEPDNLSESAHRLIESPENDIYFSAASIWEVAIKAQVARVNFSVKPGTLANAAVQSGFFELPVDSAAAAQVAELPLHHRDPFDRLLVAQAMLQPSRLLTVDRTLTKYSELIMLI